MDCCNRSCRGSSSAGLELADKADLGLEPDAEFFLHSVLRYHYQLSDVFRSSPTQIHHDVGMYVRDLGIAMAKTLEPALIDQSSRAHSFDFLEDRSGAWMKLKPGMPCPSPAQILLHDAMHRADIARCQPEGDCEGDLVTVVEDARVVTESHVLFVDEMPLSLFTQ